MLQRWDDKNDDDDYVDDGGGGGVGGCGIQDVGVGWELRSRYDLCRMEI